MASNEKETVNIKTRAIDAYDGCEWIKIDSSSEFFYGVNDLEEIEECFIQGDTLKVVFKNFHKGDVFYNKTNGHWGDPYKVK